MSDVTIYLDGRRFQAEEGKNLLAVALGLGFDVPYFCWHPALGSVGACRQCAVRLYQGDDDETGEIAMSCMTTVRDGLRASVHDEEAVAFRRSVIELLMAGHPHDCPVCDEGGECHLQDMTVMTGHVYRRYRSGKRTYRNQDLGPFLTHEMNRCIQCYRCARFYVDYAGEHDFGAYGLRNHVYFGRFADGTLRNEFSGNLVEVCPVGVFNDKTLAATYTRKWDLQTAPSVCPHCGRGCNTILGERYGELRRVLSRFSADVNGYFICDRGRFGYQFVNGDERLRRAYLRDEVPSAPAAVSATPAAEPAAVPASTCGWQPSLPRVRAATDEAPGVPWQPSLSSVAGDIVRRLGELLEGGAGVVGIGSPRASLEANFALRRLVGAERFHSGMADAESDLVALALSLYRDGGLHAPSTPELERADLVVVLGEDITNVAPMLAFSVRRWLRVRPTEDEKQLHILPWNDAGVGDVKRYLSSALWSATTAPSRLDQVTAGPLHAAPQDIARAALAVAHAFDRSLPAVDDLDDKQSAWVETLVYALMDSDHPLVITGTGCGSADVLLAAARLARALPGCLGLSVVVPEANTMGLAMMGGRRLSEAFTATAEGQVAAAVILENDLYRRAGAAEVRAFLDGCPLPVAIDHTLTPTVAHAAGVLPAATWAESTGTFVNHEGRAQRYASCLPPRDQTREGWRWLTLCMEAAGRPVAWHGLDDVLAAMADELPQLAPAREAMPGAGFRMAGMKIARGPRRYSGRTAMYAPGRMVEPPPAVDPDSPLALSMEGFDPSGDGEELPASLFPRFWSPAWNSVQALNKFQEEVGGPLRGDHAGALLFGRPHGTEPTDADSSAADAPSSARLDDPPAPSAASRPAGWYGDTDEADDPLGPPSVPLAFVPPPDEWLVVPLHHIFGGEELSALAPAVAGRVPRPYLALGEADAQSLFGGAGDGYARLDWGGLRLRLPVRRLAGLPRGVAGLPVGLPDLPGILPPFAARITPEGMSDA